MRSLCERGPVFCSVTHSWAQSQSTQWMKENAIFSHRRSLFRASEKQRAFIQTGKKKETGRRTIAFRCIHYKEVLDLLCAWLLVTYSPEWQRDLNKQLQVWERYGQTCGYLTLSTREQEGGFPRIVINLKLQELNVKTLRKLWERPSWGGSSVWRKAVHGSD